MRKQQQKQQQPSSSRHKLTLIISSFIITYVISFGTESKLYRLPRQHHISSSTISFGNNNWLQTTTTTTWPNENDYSLSRRHLFFCRCRRHDVSSFHHVRHMKTSLSFSHSSSSSSSSSYPFSSASSSSSSSSPPQPQQQSQYPRPFPGIPSRNFITLAESQFELLAHSLLLDPIPPNTTTTTTSQKSKIKSMALYLPRENPLTGQLEFTPSMIYPSPLTERIFIASAAESGLPPTIPKTLGKLQGFTHASGLMPAYPFLGEGSSNGGVGVGVGVGGVEEMEGGVVSVPLCHGAVTVGVLLIWPNLPSIPWTPRDLQQMSRAAYSLSLALSMDLLNNNNNNNNAAVPNVISPADQTEKLRYALSENLHQVKNPLQALRTFGKLLQRKLALEEFLDDEGGEWEGNGESGSGGGLAYLRNENVGRNTAIILSLANSMMVQSERVLDLLGPMDDLVRELEEQQQLQQQEGGSGDANGVTMMMRSREEERSDDDNDESFSSPAVSLPPGTNDTNSMAGVDNFFFLSDSSSSSSSSNTATFDQENANDNSDTLSHDSFQTNKNGLYLPLNNTIPSYERPPIPPSSSFSSLYLKNTPTEIGFVPDIISPLLTAFHAIAADRNISFSVYGIPNDDLPGVTLCPKALREALANVLDNAFKYVVLTRRRKQPHRSDESYPNDDDDDMALISNDDPTVTIRVTSNPSNYPAGVSIIISDNGPGIPNNPIDRQRIFERGWRVESTKKLVEGTGIGLDVARGLMEGMGGRLDVLEDDDEGEEVGTRMRLMLFRSLGGK